MTSKRNDKQKDGMTRSVANEVVGKGWTAADIPNQAGKRALVTGANSGIGYYAAVELARKRAGVLLACRDKAKGDAALARLRAEVADASAEVVLLDLASLESVRAFAAAELALGVPLDLLINNAGVYAPKTRLETADGFEIQFGTNMLGHFALTALLLPALERAAASQPQRPRVVTLASIAHKRSRLNFDDLQSTKSYSPSGSYGQSKLADLMFAFELDRRLRAAASGVMSVAAHPGVANTNLFVVGGGYYGPQGFQEMRGGDVGPAQVAAQALDKAAAARLWGECERLTGISFL